MGERSLTLLFLVFAILFGSAEANDCLGRKLSRLMDEATRDETLSSLKRDISDAKAKGSRLRDLEEEAKASKEAKDFVKEKALRAEIDGLKAEIFELNDDFITRASKLLEHEGVPNVVFKSDGHLLLRLNLDVPPTTNRAFAFYHRAKQAFGVETVTISFGENAANRRAGFFRRSEGRVEIGYNEILNLVDGEIGVTPRHEFRHAIFARKEKLEVPSAFQMKFRSSKSGNLLNEHLRYDTYMSAEELYNWSTDFQTLSKKLRDATPETEAQVLKDLTKKTDGYFALSETSSSVPEKMISRLEETIAQERYSRLEFLEGQFLGFEDDLARRVELGYFGPERKKIFDEAKGAHEALKAKTDEFVQKRIKGKGIKDKSPEYKLAVREHTREFLKTPEGKKLVAELNGKKKLLAEDALRRLKDLKRVAEVQHKAVKVLKGMLENLEKVPAEKRQDHIKAIRAQLKKVGDNVKEGYKGSLLSEENVPR